MLHTACVVILIIQWNQNMSILKDYLIEVIIFTLMLLILNILFIFDMDAFLFIWASL